MNLRRLLAITKKEFIHILRDRASLAIIFVMPVMLLFIFGYAVTTDIEHIHTGVVDLDHSPESRALVQAFVNTGSYSFLGEADTVAALTEAMDFGRIKVGLVIPHGYAASLWRDEQAPVQLLLDGSDPTVARTTLATSQIIALMQGNRQNFLRLERLGRSLVPGGVDMRPLVLYNPDMDSKRFNIPGLIGIVLQNVTVILTAFALVREKERGTMEQLIVTPVRAREIIVGKLIPYVVVASFDVALSLIVGVFWFRVPIVGSLNLLILLSFVFLLAALGMGMLISTIAKTQLQAMQMALLTLMPAILLSGFVFPREAMPTVVQWIGYLLPITYFIDILRGIMLKGVGMEALWQDTLLLLGLGILILSVSIVRFRKRLD